VLFLFIIVSSLMTHDKKASLTDDPVKLQEKSLDMQLCMKSMMGKTGADQGIHMFDQQVQDLLESSKKDASAQKLRIVLRVEDNAAPFKNDMENLSKSTSAENRAFAKLYTEPKPKKEEALALLKELDGSEISEKLAAVQVKESFGDKAIRSKTFDPNKMIGFSIFATVAIFGLGVGLVLWYIYGFQRQAGRLLPKGLAMGNIDMGRADRLIFVALLIISTYFISGSVMSQIVHHSSFAVELLVYVPIFVVIGIVFNVPIFGWRITAKSLGISFEKFPEKLGWAIGAFFANIPIMLVLVAVTASLQKFLPGGGHPVSEELMNNPSPSDLAKIALLACVIAPIWEEIFFRGLLFPAFTKAFGKPIYGALLSSFIFASIHPQGLLGIPVLMTVALMLCGVTYQTKSLVSNIILHGLHNGATLIAAVVLMPLLK
jgi:hypothetical protein